VFSRSRPEIEVQAVRTLPGVTFIAICLLILAGCSSSRNSRNDSARASGSGGNNTPFMGTPDSSSSSVPPAAPPPDKTPGDLASAGTKAGVLAGRVIDEFNRLRPGALIQVIDLDGPRDGGAPLNVLANKEGYFDVAGLEGGHNYRLIARVKDGARILTGSSRATAPNVRVAIFLTNEEPLSAGSSERKTASDRPAGLGTATPPASLGMPIKSAIEGVTTPLPANDGHDGPQHVAAGGPSAPGDGGFTPQASRPPPPSDPPGSPRTGGSAPPLPPPATDPSLIAGKEVKDGFMKSAPAVNIPGPGRESEKPKAQQPYAPPPPPETYGSGEGTTTTTTATTPLPISTAPSAAPQQQQSEPGAATAERATPATSTMVPVCVKAGDRVENFALYDLEGQVWDFRKQRKGAVVLLDFWYSECGPCRRSLPHLIELQRKYRDFGLEVVGIAYESGALSDKQKAIRPVRERYGINYTILLGGGGKGPCPMRKELGVRAFPTLVLLDGNGRIIFRTEGLTEKAAYDLEMEIRRQLRLPLR
jgi:thiol-disulfide isomerase/thioredoxin